MGSNASNYRKLLVNVELDLHTSKFQSPGQRDSVPFHMTGSQGNGFWQLKILLKRMITYVNWSFMCKNSGEVTNHRPLHCQYLTMEMVRTTMSFPTHSQRGIVSVEPLEEVGL